MRCENTASKAGPTATLVKRREEATGKPALSHPSLFMLQRRLKDLEERQAKSEEMLAHACLMLHEIHAAVRDLGGAEQSHAFKLPPETARPPVRLRWWERLLFGTFAPWKLRHPHPEALARIPE